MDTKKYEVLLCAADEGSFLRAGERLGYTQSGITQMMNSLEREIGFPLLLRGNKGVMLSEDGKRLAPLMREMVQMQARMEQECAQVRGVETGNVRIGSFSSMSMNLMPEIISLFQKEHPNVSVELQETGNAAALEAWLQAGRIDLCFYSLHDKSVFEQIPLLRDELLAVLPQNHPMRDCDAYPVKRFQDENFLMYRTSGGYDSDLHFVLKRENITPHIRFTSNFDYTIISMVANELGVSIMPRLMLEGRMEGIVAIPLAPASFRTLGIALRSTVETSPAAKKFIACAKTVTATKAPKYGLL